MNEALLVLNDITRKMRCRAEQANDDAASACATYARALWEEKYYNEAIRQLRLAAQLCPESYEHVLFQYEMSQPIDKRVPQNLGEDQ